MTPAQRRWTILFALIAIFFLAADVFDHWLPRVVSVGIVICSVVLIALDIAESGVVEAELEDVHPAQENGHFQRDL